MAAELVPTRELLDRIVYGMENQDTEFLLDTEDGEIVEESDVHEDESRFVALPDWRPVDGYNLMARFVAELRNPVYRERLRSILASGRGVFRQFKDAVGERKDIERLWHQFKQREMRAIAAEWVNDIREIQGLERMQLTEEEDTEPLVAADFEFTEGSQETRKIAAALDPDAFRENFDDVPAGLQDLLYEHFRSGSPGPADPDSSILVAKTPGDDVAALLWAFRRQAAGTSLAVVRLIYVYPEYRGLGLARQLLREQMERSRAEGCSDLVIELAGRSVGFGDAIEELGFRLERASMRVDLEEWVRNERP